MKLACTTLLLLTVATTPSFAQEDGAPPPAPELDQLQGLLGNFEGGGTYRMAAGAEAMEWTATASGEKILGGHAIQVEEVIYTGGGAMAYRTLYAFDGERDQLTFYSVTPGNIHTGDLHWTDDKTMVNVDHGTEAGQPFSQRAVTRMTADGYSFTVGRMVGTGEAFEMVSGSMKRVESLTPVAVEAAAAASVPGEPMAALAPMVGEWNLTGAINMMGMEMDITATEAVAWSMGDTVLAGQIHGQPGDYRSDWYLTFDAEAGVYKHMYVSSMGEVGMSTGRLSGDRITLTEAGTAMGEPMVKRTVVQFKDGGIARAWEDTITGAADPVRSFEAAYTRALAFSAGSCCAKAKAADAACTHPCCVTAAEKGEVCTRCNK